jgi:hypothetical protein
MKDKLKTGFADRQKAATEAKQAMLAKFRPKPTIQDPAFERRHEARAAELEAVRAARAEVKEAARQAALAAEEAAQSAKRMERKERKAQEKTDSRARREARFEAYKALRVGSSSPAAE